MAHIPLKPGLENFEHYFVSLWDKQLCGSLNILWYCFSLGLEWKLPFYSPVATAEFSKFAGILSATLSQHHLLGFEKAKLKLDCSLPGTSVHGIFQARVLEWFAISFSRRSSKPGDWTWVSHIAGRRFTIWATREALLCFLLSTEIASPPLGLLAVMLPKAHLTSHFRMSASRSVITPSWLSGSWRFFCTILLCIFATTS